MANLAEGEFRTVIEDARASMGGRCLMYAMTGRLCPCCGSTSLWESPRLLVRRGFGSTALVTRPMAWALVAGAAIFVAGAGFCLKALQSSRINLPGRKADFWQWAMLPDVERAAVLNAYLDNLKEKGAANDACNARSANALKWAKRCGAFAAIGALLTAPQRFV